MKTTEKVNFNVIDTITKIAKKLKDSCLLQIFLSDVEADNATLASYFNVTERQSLILISIYATQNHRNGEVDMKNIARFLGLEFFDILAMKPDFELLLKQKLVVMDRDRFNKSKKVNISRANFMINDDVIDSIYENEVITLFTENLKLDNCQFAKKVSDLIEERMDEKIDTYEMFEMVEELENTNETIEMVKALKNYNLGIENRTLYYEICDDLILGGWSALNKTLTDIYDNPLTRFRKAREIMEGKNPMFELELIKTKEDAFFGDTRVGLNDKGIELFLQEDAMLFIGNKKNKNCIVPEDIKDKVLFFEDKFMCEVEFVKNSLCNDKFQELQVRLNEHSLSKGVACIFYGAPGTGKTETAFQIAKATGRALLHVDISQTKSMWFGESEKKIKEIFDQYRHLCKASKVKPILLFNEADAVFGKRKDTGASTVAQTENAIQNIILEEMEKLDGILMATTNLTDNLDAAFERRFLFKLKFEQPSASVKKQIWKNKLEWMDEEAVGELADKFNFSGGEIDNIVRKTITEEILTGIRPSNERIKTFCETEKISSKMNRCKVGF
jgi:hypothetical protein